MPVSRNQPCPCGSGRKYKYCCLGSGANPRPAVPASDTLRAALACHRAGDLDRAEDLYRRLLRSPPVPFDALHMLGVLRGQRGHSAEAAALIRKALALQPRSAEAHNNLGSFLQAQHQYAAAVVAFEAALAIRPDYPEALNNLGNALRHTDRPLCDVIGCYERAIRLQPAYSEAHLNLGLALLRQGHPQEAARCFRRTLELNPQAAGAHHNLGLALQQLGRHDAALGAYESAVALRPDNEETHNNLGNLYRTAGQLERALACYRRAVELRPAYAEAGCNMALALAELDRHEEAIECYRAVLVLDPQHREAQYGMARIQQQLGRFGEAAGTYRRLLQAHPGFADAYAGFVGCRRMTTEDWPVTAGMEALLASATCDGPGRAALHFALGKAYDDLQNYERAIGHFHRGNALHARDRPFDRVRHEAAIDALIRTYGPAVFHQVVGGGDMSCTPLFIVGMPRSGTTLVEDLLSRHPGITAAGELDFWARFASSAPETAHTDSEQEARAAAGDYMRLLTTLARGASLVTDKLTTNFLRLGLLHQLMPQARVVHSRRNPIDTCLSCYFTRFAGIHDYAYSLDDLAFYYEQYRRLMRHWRGLFPPNQMIEVDYEEVIADPEAAAHRLIAFCGLEWKPQYLTRPAADQRAIRTASKWQVRQPVYNTSIERWRNYEPFLGPLARLRALN